jgi:hypothetical protein
VFINKEVVKTGGGRAWITIISPLHSLTNKWSRGRRDGGPWTTIILPSAQSPIIHQTIAPTSELPTTSELPKHLRGRVHRAGVRLAALASAVGPAEVGGAFRALGAPLALTALASAVGTAEVGGTLCALEAPLVLTAWAT